MGGERDEHLMPHYRSKYMGESYAEQVRDVEGASVIHGRGAESTRQGHIRYTPGRDNRTAREGALAGY